MHWIDRLSLSSKLLVLPVVFAMGLLIYAANAQSTLDESRVLGPNYNRVIQKKDLVADVLPPPNYLVETYLNAMLLAEAQSPREHGPFIEEHRRLKREFNERIDYWSKELEPGVLKNTLMQNARAPAEKMMSIIDSELIPAAQASNRAATEAALQKLKQPFTEHHAAILEVIKLSQQMATDTEREVDAMITSRTRIQLLFALGIMVAVVGLSLWLRRLAVLQATREKAAAAELHRQTQENADREREQAESLQKRAVRVLEAVNRAAAGDLSQTIPEQGTDTLGQVAVGIENLMSSLRQNITVVAENARLLNAASREVTAVSERLNASASMTADQAQSAAAGAVQVNATLQSVSTGTEELSAAIREIAKNSAEAARVATSAVSVAEKSNLTIAKLGESSAEIGAVVKVITTIAQQTNLLALNATIEAARAGESGKGFAVVANEVKELAKATAKATNDIGRMIETIQTDTKSAVTALGEISRVISQVHDFQNTIASAVEEQTATTREMSRIVKEGANGAKSIAESVTAVAKAAVDTTDGAHQAEQAATSLSTMGSTLKNVLDSFNVGTSTEPRATKPALAETPASSPQRNGHLLNGHAKHSNGVLAESQG